jgi:hypothetical protein
MSGTSCSDTTPNTKPLSDMMRANSAMPTVRRRPSSTGPSCALSGALVAAVSVASSRRDRPSQLSGRQTARLMAAKMIKVPRQP